MIPFLATKRPVGHGHGAPPDSFLQTIVDWAKGAADAVFAPNTAHDIYSLLAAPEVLGPYPDLAYRRGVLCEALRVIAADESDWGWTTGRDTTAGAETPDQMEAGAWQVSYDSRLLGPDLQAFLLANGITDAWQFQTRIKADPLLDVAYTARLLREEYKRWDGPINRGWIAAQVRRDAVAEFQQLIAE